MNYEQSYIYFEEDEFNTTNIDAGMKSVADILKD